MRSISTLAGLLLAGMTTTSAVVGSSTPFAEFVVSFNPGIGSGFGVPEDVLGPPEGAGASAGSFDVYTLGVQGDLTLELGSRCFDGPGADLMVAENPLLAFATGNSFAELMFVEVSSDGNTFVRFPTRYLGPDGPFAPFEACPIGDFVGFAGVMPVFTSSLSGTDPLDVVAAGGDAFDLADLADTPEVLARQVDLDDINFVRLVDVQAGADFDSLGQQVWDHGLDNSASADADAIVTFNATATFDLSRPAVEMELDASGFLTIELHDPEGFKDIKTGLKASVNAIPVDFYTTLLPFFAIQPIDPQTIRLVTGPIPPGFIKARLKVAAVDGAGLTSGDAISLY